MTDALMCQITVEKKTTTNIYYPIIHNENIQDSEILVVRRN